MFNKLKKGTKLKYIIKKLEKKKKLQLNFFNKINYLIVLVTFIYIYDIRKR